MDVGWPLVQFSVTMSSHCFRSAEAQALGRPIHNWQLRGYTCVFSYPGMILLYRKCVWCPAKKDLSHCRSDNQMVLHGGSKLTVFFCIRNSISFKKISITTGWNAAPYHDRASMMFYRYLKAVRNERWTENKWKRNTSRKPGELLLKTTSKNDSLETGIRCSQMTQVCLLNEWTHFKHRQTSWYETFTKKNQRHVNIWIHWHVSGFMDSCKTSSR